MKPLAILFGALTLAACSSKPPEPVAKAPPIATPFDAMRAEEQRAKDVQKTVDRQAEEQRKQIEAQQQLAVSAPIERAPGNAAQCGLQRQST